MTNTNPYDAWADRTMSDIDLPNGLINASSGNDVCPSLMTQPIGNGNFYVQLFVDYKDPADREDPDSDRYTVFVMSDDGDHYHHTTDVYGHALTAVLGYQFALMMRDALIDTVPHSTAHLTEWGEMCALYFDDSARPVVNPTDYSSEYCDRKTPVMDTAFTSIYGPLPNDHRIYNEANVEMEKAYEFAVNHVFVPTGNGDAEEV